MYTNAEESRQDLPGVFWQQCNQEVWHRGINMNKGMRNERGFTLIELSIVLVIIGIIIGAVLKGQDLIQNARNKKFINDVKKWEIALWAYEDRKGRFPGDSNKDGIIGNSAADDVATDISNAKFVDAPPRPITVGSVNLYVFVGNDGATPRRNVIMICADTTCSTSLTEEALKAIEAFDTAIDGSSDAASGRVQAFTAAPTTVTDAKDLYDGTSGVYATVPPKEWVLASLPTYYAMVYRFDRP